jgi:hypothetical protein
LENNYEKIQMDLSDFVDVHSIGICEYRSETIALYGSDFRYRISGVHTLMAYNFSKTGSKVGSG